MLGVSSGSTWLDMARLCKVKHAGVTHAHVLSLEPAMVTWWFCCRALLTRTTVPTSCRVRSKLSTSKRFTSVGYVGYVGSPRHNRTRSETCKSIHGTSLPYFLTASRLQQQTGPHLNGNVMHFLCFFCSANFKSFMLFDVFGM